VQEVDEFLPGAGGVSDGEEGALGHGGL
jgi:hypothetical protein